MFLRRLEMVGFKSFANRTTLDLDPGISVFVGPNGSGKSNIADAVRWVLGEQSARAVRGKQSQDVIFAGSSTRQPLGMAEVSLTLENGDARIPLPFGEVRISRRLYRSGESDYLINGSKVRLKDVVEALTHAGLGPESYSVIGQGAVDELIMQRPEERRIAFEGAADIRRYQTKLAETRARLEATEQNLTRSQDVVAELEPHLRRLKGQAERAERAEQLRAELASLATRWYRRRLAEVKTELEQAERERTAAIARREALEAELARKEAAWADLEQRREDREAHARALRPKQEAWQVEHERRSRDAAVLEERLTQLIRRAETLKADLARTNERVARLEADLGVAEQSLRQAEETASAPESGAHTLGEAIHELEENLQRSEDARQELDGRRTTVDQGIANFERATAGDEARIEALEAARQTLEQAAHASKRTLAELDEQIDREQQATERAAARLAELESVRQTLEAEHASLARSAADQERELVGLEREVARLEAAAGQLSPGTSWEVGTGLPKHIGEARGGVLGVLGARLYVAAEYERAIGAALGALARAHVVGSEQTAVRIIEQLLTADGRWILLLDQLGCDNAEFKTHVRSLFQDGSLRGFADELVDAPSEIGSIVAGALGRTAVVARDWLLPSWRRLSADGGVAGPWQLVDLEGNLARSDGEWLIGRGGETDVLLSRERERRRVTSELQQARSRRDAAHLGLSATREKVEDIRNRLDQATASATNLKQESQVSRTRAQELQGSRGRTAEQARAAEERLAATQRTLEQLRKDQQRRAASLAPLRDERERILAQLASARAPLEELRHRLAQQRAELAAARSGLAARQAEARVAADLHERIHRELQAARHTRQEMAQELDRVAQERQTHEPLLAELRARLEQLNTELAPLRRELAASEAEQRQMSDTRHSVDKALSALRRELREADAGVEMATLAQERLSDELKRLRREAAQSLLGGDQEPDDEWPVQLRLSLEPSRVADVEEESIPDMAAARRRIATLERDLRSVGAVGEGVLEEYREMAARHAFLNEQSVDLRAAIGELREAMHDLETVMAERFSETFARVDAAFQETFAILFGGGAAQLVLTRPESLLETGIEVVARPPGKRLQGLMSLSGGERALTSVALLFALLEVNPTPFVLLDEVDAALDESNVQRFADMLKTYAEQSQFVVVTHNRATMEVGDALFGVSMEAGGVSKVLSLRLTAA